MTDPVYILIRTSGRPRFFARAMESVKNQTYGNIQTIVHTDDPRDGYVTGDIIIKGSAYSNQYGNGFYNLYNNRLLDAIPDAPGWYCFLDDDDEYTAPDIIERLVKSSKRDHVNVGRVIRIMRGRTRIFPERWGHQRTFQTECFFLHTDHKRKARWWPNLGGDHDYSGKLTRVMPINWIDDIVIARAQERKGCGERLDAGHAAPDYRNAYSPNQRVPVLGMLPCRNGDREARIVQGEFKLMQYKYAYELERQGKVKITYAEQGRRKPPVRNIYELGGFR